MSKNRNKAPKLSVKDILYYINPKNISAEIRSYGFQISIARAVCFYILYFALALGIGYIYELHKVPIVLIAICGIFFMPVLIRSTYKNKYEQRRFSDVTHYMEHMLYSFKGTHSILKSLTQVEESFVDGPMKTAIKDAEKEILYGKGAHTGHAGVKIIENEYRCEKLRTMHRLLLKVEELGGDFDKSIDLLLDDRSMWVDRVAMYQKKKKDKVLTVLFSVFISAGIPLFVQKQLPADVNITDNIAVQIMTTLMLLVDLIIMARAYSRLATDWLSNKDVYTTEQIKKYYTYVETFDEEKSKKIARKGFILGLLILIIGAVFKSSLICVAAALFALYALLRDKIRYTTRKKAIENEIKVKFPRWLMEISLQLQTESVYHAIVRSIPSAPTVLQPELNRFKRAIDKNPNSQKAYIQFLRNFEVPEVQSSMQMLQSIANGSGGDPETQIADIIRRNNNMLDKSEKKAFEDQEGILHALFLLPQLSSAGKLVVDMLVFFLIFMSNTTY